MTAPNACTICGRKVGDIGRNGLKLLRLPIVMGSKHVDLMHWCSMECYDEWLQKCKTDRERTSTT